MSFSDNLNSLMDKNNVKTADLARGIGTSGSQVSGWRSGQKEPTYKNILKILDFFDVSADIIFGREQTIRLSAIENDLISGFRSLTEYEKGIIIGRLEGMIELKKEC